MHQLLSISCQTFHIYSSLYWIYIYSQNLYQCHKRIYFTKIF